jgi:hypothetical protein
MRNIIFENRPRAFVVTVTFNVAAILFEIAALISPCDELIVCPVARTPPGAVIEWRWAFDGCYGCGDVQPPSIPVQNWHLMSALRQQRIFVLRPSSGCRMSRCGAAPSPPGAAAAAAPRGLAILRHERHEGRQSRGRRKARRLPPAAANLRCPFLTIITSLPAACPPSFANEPTLAHGDL